VAAVVDRALAHECHRDWDVEPLSERAQVRRRVPSQHAVAGQDQRPRRVDDQLRGVLDRLVGRLGEVGLVRFDRAEIIRDGCRRQVLGELDVGRARLLELGHTEGLSDDLGDGAGQLDALVPLRYGLEHAHDVDELVRFLVELVEPGLARDRDHGSMVEIGIGDPGHEVGGTGSEGGHRDGRSAGQATVDVGHERGALLVPRRDVADGVLAAQRVQDVHRLLARDREDVLAALGLEAFDEQRCGGPRGVGHARQSTGVPFPTSRPPTY
jgi:hypothetical protein